MYDYILHYYRIKENEISLIYCKRAKKIYIAG